MCDTGNLSSCPNGSWLQCTRSEWARATLPRIWARMWLHIILVTCGSTQQSYCKLSQYYYFNKVQGHLSRFLMFVLHHLTRWEIRNPVLKTTKQMSISVDLIRKSSVWDKASVINHSRGNTQYWALLIRALQLKPMTVGSSASTVSTTRINGSKVSATWASAETSLL